MEAQASEGPRVRVAALMTHQNQVVLVRHRKDDAVYYLLPGGGVRFGETLESALKREVAEETGLKCRVSRPLVINDTIDPDGARHVVNITLSCEVTGGNLTDSPDDPRVEAVELTSAENLTSIDLRPPIAELLVESLGDPGRFSASYAGSVFTPERHNE